MSFVYLFPGQSSRYPEMLERASLMAPREASLILERASDVLGHDVRARFARPDPFERNSDVQLAVFLTTQIHLRALEHAGVRAVRSLGLSLGEYSHLVHAGALELDEALRLIAARGSAYDEGPRGAMASIFPLPLEAIEPLVERARDKGALEVTGYNSPTQHVVSGDEPALRTLEALLDEEEPGSAFVWIERSVPMHAWFFRPAADRFRPALEAASFACPRLPYLPNVLGTSLADPKRSTLVDLLYQHVFRPVLFRQSIEHLAAVEPGAVFVEVGPRGVLAGLLRRWQKTMVHKTDGEEGDPSRAFEGLLEELDRAA
ncbi:MAG: ACP S-malonyltransferase [Sandaracinaceae bacterium]|nr:ACP S-malonyltransferase [Sandaracinaceae bacterium]